MRIQEWFLKRDLKSIVYTYFCENLFYNQNKTISVFSDINTSHEIFSLNKKYFKDIIIENENLFKLFLNIFNKVKQFNNLMLDETTLKNYENVIYNIEKKLEIVNKSKKNSFITFNNFFKK